MDAEVIVAIVALIVSVVATLMSAFIFLRYYPRLKLLKVHPIEWDMIGKNGSVQFSFLFLNQSISANCIYNCELSCNGISLNSFSLGTYSTFNKPPKTEILNNPLIAIPPYETTNFVCTFYLTKDILKDGIYLLKLYTAGRTKKIRIQISGINTTTQSNGILHPKSVHSRLNTRETVTLSFEEQMTK